PREEIQFVPGTALPILVKEDGEAVGGRLAIAGSLETLFPLVTEYNPFRDREEILIKGVLFVDAGNLVEKASINDLLRGFRVSTGAGIRMRLPALGGVILLLDWAHVLSKQDGDETRALSFELTRRF
ncbi:MAG: outer membrane protein assembly factor BamA, partial [Pseudohongiellaceae bacterium]